MNISEEAIREVRELREWREEQALQQENFEKVKPHLMKQSIIRVDLLGLDAYRITLSNGLIIEAKIEVEDLPK